LNLLSFAAICALACARALAAAGAALADLGMVPHHALDHRVLGAHDQHLHLAPAWFFFIGFFEAAPA
jgi:hypothetical protein